MGVLCSFLLFGYIGLNFYQQYLDVDQVTVVDQSVLKYRSSDAENVVEKYKDKEREFDVLYKEYMSLKKSAPTSDIVMASEKVHTTEDTGLADDIVAQ